MSKPYGVDIFMQVQKPSSVEDIIWEAVEKAILYGWTPKQFRAEAAEAWEQALRDQAKRAREDFR